MEEMLQSNAVTSAEGALAYVPSKLSLPVPREMVENDALPLAMAGGNTQGLTLRQVMNDLGPLASSTSIDVKEAGPEIAATAWAAIPPMLPGQEIETGAPPSLWCKDGH